MHADTQVCAHTHLLVVDTCCLCGHVHAVHTPAYSLLHTHSLAVPLT